MSPPRLSNLKLGGIHFIIIIDEEDDTVGYTSPHESFRG